MDNQTLRVGEIAFTNYYNVFHYLRREPHPDGVQFIPGAPADLNAMLRRGELDLSPVSSVEFARRSPSYFLLPDYCLASTGPIWSIRLFSHTPIEDLDSAQVILTGQSETAAVLCKVILGHFYGQENEYRTERIDLEEALERADAVLLIGDLALAAGQRASRFFVYDLADLWREKTGLPFVFALWTLRREYLQNDLVRLTGFWRALQRAHELIRNPDEELLARVLVDKPFLTRSMVLEYWNLISYELTPNHLRGLELFYRLGHSAGELPPPPEPAFFNPENKYSTRA
jgi:chorismate dehydratase